MTATSNDSILKRARQLMPAGVNSPVRAFNAVGGQPAFITRAQGCRLTDADGKTFIDYVGSWGPAIVGHADPDVVRAVQEVAASGLSFGAPTEREVEFAELVSQRQPSIEMMRCVSSGTEATMSALRLARGYTKRDVIVKFAGAYHGHSDCLLVQAGSGAATFGAPDSAGVPAAMVQDTVVTRYNDLSELERLFAAEGKRIAAVIVEPVAGNMGCVPPAPGFLQGIVDLCQKHGAVSIFDEVMTGCRVSPGGAQELYDVRPDLTCLGKVIGGGLPLAVYGGKREIMQCVAPLGPVYQAGTLSGNPLAVTAGMATLRKLGQAVYTQLEQRGAQLEQGISDALLETKVPGCVQRVGSMLTLFFNPGPVTSWDTARECDTERFGRWHRALFEQGVYWPPAQFEAAFLSAAHTKEDVDQTIAAIKRALARVS